MDTHVIPLGPPVKMAFRHCALEHSTVFPALSGRTLSPAQAAEIGHRPILEALAALRPGEAIRIDVDHDPEPLLRIIESSHPAAFAWEPMLTGPNRWVGLIRRREPGAASGAARRLPTLLQRRATYVDARARLDRTVRELAVDLLGPAGHDELSPQAELWLSTATDAAVGAVRDGALSVLIRALETLLEAAPPEVARELRAVRERHDLDVV